MLVDRSPAPSKPPLADAPRFRTQRQGPVRGVPWSLIAVLVLVTAALVARSFWLPPASPAALIEVVGEVPQPGLYPVAPPRIHSALRAAGREPGEIPDGPVPAGYRVIVGPSSVRVERPRDPVLVSIPIDPNTAELHELSAIPGIGSKLANRILEDRRNRGPYRKFEDLRRVPGLRSEILNRIEPFVQLSSVGPIDLNTASAGELETLPGIGPVFAARIIVDRDENGPYASVFDLQRVPGVGAQLVESLSEQAVALP